MNKPNPKTGSAAVAKERLLWCIRNDRFAELWGASWELQGFEPSPGFRAVMRWRWPR